MGLVYLDIMMKINVKFQMHLIYGCGIRLVRIYKYEGRLSV